MEKRITGTIYTQGIYQPSHVGFHRDGDKSVFGDKLPMSLAHLHGKTVTAVYRCDMLTAIEHDNQEWRF